MPLYKLILANFGRLGLVAPQLAGPLSDPIARLEVSAAGVIEEVLDLARAAAA
jgi:hypothetical protein